MVRFTRESTWSCSAHETFIESLAKNDADSVEISCRHLMTDAIRYLYGIYEAENLLPQHEEYEYVLRFVRATYSFPDDKSVDIDGLIHGLQLYTRHCRVSHAFGEVRRNTELGIAIGILVKLGDILQYQAMSLTVKWYRHMREFLDSPMNCSVKRGIGFDILACSEHVHRLKDNEMPLDHVPCNLIFYHIASTFGIKVAKVNPVRNFDDALSIAVSVRTKRLSEQP